MEVLRVFKPRYKWIMASDICPRADQKVLILRDSYENAGKLIDGLIVETAYFDNENMCFWNAHNERLEIKDVMLWSLFPKLDKLGVIE